MSARSARAPGAEASFSTRIIAWQLQSGRHDLPWQASRDPYRIWLSEVMLQQTQVQTVIPYYLRFLEAFADVGALAQAPLERVMQLWSGLGYYSRARNLHRCAQQVVLDHGGRFPTSAQALATLPGIGPSTAAAIAALAFGERAAILDGNVKRVLCRHFGIDGWPGERRVEQQLWAVAERELPERGIEPYTQGLMDLGAGLCSLRRPQCDPCPVRESCVARATDRQSEWPARRPSRQSPERHTAMMVIVRGDWVLLERRPPLGIWGGLLSLPEAPPAPHAVLIDEATRRFGVHVRGVRELAPIRHAFTHYRLLITPVVLEVRATQRLRTDHAAQWLKLSDAKDEALAAPVRSLLITLSDERLTRRSDRPLARLRSPARDAGSRE